MVDWERKKRYFVRHPVDEPRRKITSKALCECAIAECKAIIVNRSWKNLRADFSIGLRPMSDAFCIGKMHILWKMGPLFAGSKKWAGKFLENLSKRAFVPNATFQIHLESEKKEAIRGANGVKFGISIPFWKKARKSWLK